MFWPNFTKSFKSTFALALVVYRLLLAVCNKKGTKIIFLSETVFIKLSIIDIHGYFSWRY